MHLRRRDLLHTKTNHCQKHSKTNSSNWCKNKRKIVCVRPSIGSNKSVHSRSASVVSTNKLFNHFLSSSLHANSIESKSMLMLVFREIIFLLGMSTHPMENLFVSIVDLQRVSMPNAHFNWNRFECVNCEIWKVIAVDFIIVVAVFGVLMQSMIALWMQFILTNFYEQYSVTIIKIYVFPSFFLSLLIIKRK